MQPTVQTSVISRHESHIRGQELELLRHISCGVGPGHLPAGVGQPDKTVKVGDRDWFGIDRIEAGQGRAEEMEVTAHNRVPPGIGTGASDSAAGELPGNTVLGGRPFYGSNLINWP